MLALEEEVDLGEGGPPGFLAAPAVAHELEKLRRAAGRTAGEHLGRGDTFISVSFVSVSFITASKNGTIIAKIFPFITVSILKNHYSVLKYYRSLQ